MEWKEEQRYQSKRSIQAIGKRNGIKMEINDTRRKETIWRISWKTKDWNFERKRKDQRRMVESSSRRRNKETKESSKSERRKERRSKGKEEQKRIKERS